MVRKVLIVLLLGLTATTLSGQNGPKNGNDWRAYASDPGSSSTRPSIRSTKTTRRPAIAWRFKTDNFGPRPDYNMQVTPLDGQRRDVRAGGNAARRRGARSDNR